MHSDRSCHTAAYTLDRRTFIASSIGSLVGVHALARGGTSAHRMDSPARPPGVPPARLATLARGINLSHWVWFPHAQGEAARRAFITDADLAQLVASGFTHARFPFEPDWLWNSAEHRLNDASLREYLDAVRRCHGAGLAIIIDAHWSRTPWIKPGEPSHEARMGELERMWSSLGAACRDLDPERTFLEIVNEPHDITAAAWAESQALIAGTIREVAPDHTIIATGASWGSFDGLLALEPLDDPNTVYSFHFYEPHNFTHQGATWGFPPWRGMKDIPWPAGRAELERISEPFPKDSRDALRWSARDGTSDPWTPDRLDVCIERAHQWALTHKRPIYCGEFGAHKPTAPRDSRLAWTRALAESLNRRSIGWAMWDYVGGFAIAEGAPGARMIDAEMCDALVLRPR